MSGETSGAGRADGGTGGGGAGSVLGWRVWPPLVRPALKRLLIEPLTARGHVRRLEGVVAEAGVSGEEAARAVRIARATGLWREEQVDVAREIAAHFADARAGDGSGVDRFGDERAAARLIRRAKMRGRPPAWKAARGVAMALAGLVVVAGAWYGVVAYRYFAGEPTLSRNILRELNASVVSVPEAERAWPAYIESVEVIGKSPDRGEASFGWPVHASDARFGEVRDWLATRPGGRSGVVEAILKAAGRERLGYVFTHDVDRALMAAMSRVEGREWTEPARVSAENPPALGILLAPLGHLRLCARVLAADAAVAGAEGDGERLVRNVEGMYAVARHAQDGRFLISDLVGIAIAEMAQRVVAAHLGRAGQAGEGRALFTDEQLGRLAAAVAGFGGGRPMLFELARERDAMDDIIQRTYTDDGRGDGRAIRGRLEAELRQMGYPQEADAGAGAGLRPLKGLRVPGRAELVKMVDAAFARAEEDQRLPLRRRAERSSGVLFERLSDEAFSSLVSIGVVPALERAFLTRDLFEARRDGVLVGIALERFRVREGVYPGSLEALVPEFLAKVPGDPLAEGTLRYRLEGDGSGARPVVYSVFLDGVDDGGREARAAQGMIDELVKRAGDARPRGDWVVYSGRVGGG